MFLGFHKNTFKSQNFRFLKKILLKIQILDSQSQQKIVAF